MYRYVAIAPLPLRHFYPESWPKFEHRIDPFAYFAPLIQDC